jgi:hypothetical protein
MSDFLPPVGYHGIKLVKSFEELVGTAFGGEVNALCWCRELSGNFGEVLEVLAAGEGITTLEDEDLEGLCLSEEGRLAVEFMLGDLRRLREHGLEPVLDCVNGYLRDADPGPVPTDVFSFHVDSATAEADTYLCTYHGPASEGLRNDEAVRRVDVPETRAELLKLYGGDDDEGFREFLSENCFDLHYAMLEGAKPFGFGVGNLWRIAVAYQGSPVTPCIHRAPETMPGDPGRLLLIS